MQKVIETWRNLNNGEGFYKTIKYLIKYVNEKVLITGITGQDGAYSQKLLEKNYKVWDS